MSDSLSRRAFLQSSALATTAAAIAPSLAAQSKPKPAEPPYPENGLLIPDEDWRLWVDEKAEWQSDDIFLPEDISWIDGELCAKGKPLPINPPTGGWATLTHDTGLEVTLPTSVEQHFWGKHGSRPYTPEEYRYAATDPPKPPADDNIPQNGAYFGVSWFHRRIDIPAELRGKRIFLHIRGAHLRAEVYLNQKLVGYSIMEELPFECDCTGAANPGVLNVLAIRITNPFGRFDWVDGLNAKWGKVSLYRSHGFGALDRGITLSAHGDVRIKDAFVLNTSDPRSINVRVILEGTNCPGRSSIDGRFTQIQVVDPQTGKAMSSTGIETGLSSPFCGAGGLYPPKPTPPKPRFTDFAVDAAHLTCATAQLWTLEKPKLYHLQITFTSESGAIDTRTIAFGFRSFAVTGIDPGTPNSNAVFRLNGKRAKIYTAISWGYWGLNGMFPVPELAEKEVRAAQALGLNCLNFHRNLAKEDVLRWHDRLGVLRYMEPGAGKMAIGKLPARTDASANSVVMQKPSTEADKFAQRYMFTKCVEMVKAFRSHPSVIEYCLQNELGADLKNPDTLAILKAMHDEDPSRCIVLNDGFVAPPRSAAQAWYEPWDDTLKEGKLHRSDEEKWGDWWNNHQGAGDQWYDEFYKSPTDFTYNINLRNVLTEYGEMEGCARPDIHGFMVHQITETYKKYSGAASSGASYDLKDHEEIITGYNNFLDKWGFRKSFPTPDHVFRAVGRTCYESWQNYMENARVNDALDFAAISGWESTAIENHSGIVDNLRNHKSDPHLIGDTLQPIRPCAKQRTLSIELGKPATFDLFLFNDTHQPATGTLTFSMITPNNKRVELKILPVPASQPPDQFSYLLEEAFTTPPLKEEGLYRFKFALSSAPLATQTKELWVTHRAELPISSAKLPSYDMGVDKIIAVSGITANLRQQLSDISGADVRDWKPGTPCSVIISAGITSHTHADGTVGETTGLEAAPPMKPGHTPEPGEEAQIIALGHLQTGILDAVRSGTPLLAIPQTDTLSDGVAKELAAAGGFSYHGAVGDFRAPWMGNWYFVREHALFDGLPQNCALGGFYQCKGRPSNGLLIDQASTGAPIEVIVGYSRDHDRNVGAGTFTTRLGKGKVLFHRCPEFHPALQQRFLANALRWLTT